jgi:putative salt-induced outer membrane protein YdiY
MSSPRMVVFGLLAVACLTLSVSAHGEETPDLRLLPPVDDEAAVEQVLTPHADTWEDLVIGDDGKQHVVDGFAIWEEKIYWQDWLLPAHWKVPRGWVNSFEVGVDGSEGNSTTLTFRTGTNIRRKIDWSDLKVAINYVKSSAEYVEKKHNAQLEVNHDWLFGKSPWSPYGKGIGVYDEFQPFRFELTLNAGIGYRFIDTEVLTFKVRVGSGASRKFRGSNNTWEPEALLGTDCEHKISGRQKLRATVEYYPEWGDFTLYRIRTDAAWEVLLDEDTNMSLKLGVIDRYDTRDTGKNPNALDYTLLLLWKL